MNILRRKRSFKVKQKAFFMILKDFKVCYKPYKNGENKNSCLFNVAVFSRIFIIDIPTWTETVELSDLDEKLHNAAK